LQFGLGLGIEFLQPREKLFDFGFGEGLGHRDASISQSVIPGERRIIDAS